MNYLLSKIKTKKLPMITQKFDVLFKTKNIAILLFENLENDAFVKKISIDILYINSLDNITFEIEALLKKRKINMAYMLFNILLLILFVFIVFTFLSLLYEDRKDHIDETFINYIKHLAMEKDYNIHINEYMSDIYASSVVLPLGSFYISAHSTGINNHFIIPYIGNLSDLYGFKKVLNYRNIFSVIELASATNSKISIFNNEGDIFIGSEIFIISHPYGLTGTKTFGIINGTGNDIYGNVFYTSNIPLSNEMLGGIVQDKNKKNCGIILPAYREHFTNEYEPAIFPLSFIKEILREDLYNDRI